ncbi:THAP domain-containing protein 8-like [Dysidea avara]|uniref:THAP domain-containing protein 8-like n=1 Tax=Dysidea avara TaxID=196820 RepID=UPI00332FFBC3
MPNTCCVLGCSSRAGRHSNKRFFRVPADVQRKTKWVSAINRRYWSPNEYTRLCSDHFVCGQPSTDPAHPDYVPSIFKEGDKVKAKRKLERYQRAKMLAEKKRERDPPKLRKQLRARKATNMDIVYTLLELSKQPRIYSSESITTEMTPPGGKDNEIART